MLSFDRVFWSDVDNKFSVDARGDLVVRTNFDALIQAVENVLLTMQGERPMRPEFGSRLTTALFDQVTESNAQMVSHYILEALEQEGRVEPVELEVIAHVDEQYYSVRLVVKPTDFDKEIEVIRILRRASK